MLYDVKAYTNLRRRRVPPGKMPARNTMVAGTPAALAFSRIAMFSTSSKMAFTLIDSIRDR